MKLLDPANVGAEAVRKRLVAADPEHATAFNRVFGTPGEKYPDSSAPNYPVEGTFEQLVANQNEIAARLAALEAAQAQRPFG